VDDVNDAPVTGLDAYTVGEDDTLTVPAPGVLGNDTDPEGQPLTAVVATPPTNGTVVLNPDGSLTYTPNPDFFGTDTFTYTAGDGETSSDPVSVTITVTGVNDAPTATDGSYFAVVGEPLTVPPPGVLGNDTDPDGDPLTAMLVDDPTNGTVVVNPDGSFTYTPNPGFEGDDTFTYTASDGELTSEPATVTITVAPPNAAPVAVDDSYTTTTGTRLTVSAPGVLENDGDADGDLLAAVLQSAAAHGTVVLNADGSFTYTPNAGFVGTDTFTYLADDGQGPALQAKATSQPATVTITVAAAVPGPGGPGAGGGAGLPVTGAPLGESLAAGGVTTALGLLALLARTVYRRRRRAAA
jgi:VCBS repeat-containing protein